MPASGFRRLVMIGWGRKSVGRTDVQSRRAIDDGLISRPTDAAPTNDCRSFTAVFNFLDRPFSNPFHKAEFSMRSRCPDIRRAMASISTQKP
jgi:hypothetical protein